MSNLNKVLLIGHVGAKPEIRFTQNGTQVGNFSVATAEQWKDAAGVKQQRTQWHRIVVWQGLAEICGQFLDKGKKVYIEGRFQSREYTHSDGTKRMAFEVVAQEMKLLDRNPNPDPSQYAQVAEVPQPQNGAAAAPVAKAAPVAEAPLPEAPPVPEAELEPVPAGRSDDMPF